METENKSMQLQLDETVFKLGFESLNPLQEQALKQGFLEKPRVVVSAPTASGKTLLALLAVLDNHEKTKTKAVYVVPLRALASEKYREFKERLAPFGLSIALSTGDLDSSSEQLHAFDVIVATSEKMDSLLRHKVSWIKDVGLAVIDEVHLLDDLGRGATLEVVMTKLLEKDCRMLCLSATIPNCGELSGWLAAELVESGYRPVPLRVGVNDGERLFFEDETLQGGKQGFLVQKALTENRGKGQALVFVSTRRNAESVAQELIESTKAFLGEEDKKQCRTLSQKALKALGMPTMQCRALAKCLENGVAFHHAGLISRQRELIEQGFKRERCLKAIVCTTTLAMGLDYPASWVIVRDLKRFNGAFAEFIPALEVFQMVGRAGRPAYDKRGTGVLCCSATQKKRVADRYVLGALENVYSKLSFEPVLRGHCLGLIASGHCKSFASLFSFFEKTFYAFQYGDAQELLSKVEAVVRELKEIGFVVEKKNALLASPVGKRVSELYIDPWTAAGFLEFIQSGNKKEFDCLMALGGASESRPLVAVKRNEENALWEEAMALDLDLSDDEALEKFKTAKLLNAWVNEATEEKILEDFKVPPGVVHSRARNAEWLAYALQELAFLLNASRAYAQAKIVRKRIKYGAKKELLELCSIRGIGRVRARRLWKAGIKTREQYAALTKDEKRRLTVKAG